jgi:hypothetical protein
MTGSSFTSRRNRTRRIGENGVREGKLFTFHSRYELKSGHDRILQTLAVAGQGLGPSLSAGWDLMNIR